MTTDGGVASASDWDDHVAVTDETARPIYPGTVTAGVLVGGTIIVVGFVGTIVTAIVFVVQALGHLLGF